MTSEVYPSIDELLPPVLLAMIPASLSEEICERYELLGGKYLTTEITEDGRQVNRMMYSNRVQNCIEEIVDAVFCIVGEIFKRNTKQIDPGENLYALLEGLIQIYSLLVAEMPNAV